MKKFAVLFAICLVVMCIFTGCKAPEEAPVEEPAATMVNPMVETDADGLMEQLGLRLNCPENAENVKYFVIAGNLGEMQFTMDGVKLSARIQPAAEYTDISGMYYDFETEEEISIGSCQGKHLRHSGDGENAEVVLWFDVAPGIMYSLSGQGDELSAIDFPAIAEQVYAPMQGEVG